MAKFCTKCGSPVEETLKFCPKCGNALTQATAPAPGAAAPPVPAPGAPPAPAAAAPAAKAGSPVLKIVLIVLGVIVLFSLLGIGACVFGIYKARQKVHQLAESARVTHTFGTPEVHAEKTPESSETPTTAAAIPDDLAYPGATATESGGNISFGGIGVSGQEYETSDPVDKVVAFYKEKLGSKAMLQESEGKTTIVLSGSNGMVTVIIEPEEGADKTKISVSRIKK
jgi:hypothetical protein